MSYKYTGGVFKIPFPFSDPTASKSRPAMALSEPDKHGDMSFVFITTKQSQVDGQTLDIPQGLLPFRSHIHLNKIFLLNKNIILKEIARVDTLFLEEALKKVILLKTKHYYENIHYPLQQKPFVWGKSKINYAGRIFDELEMCNLVDSSLEFWLTYGRFCRQFEKQLAEFLGTKYAFIVNSGSSANLLAFMALTSPLLKERAIKRGDEVITVAAGFPTTVAPIVQYGAVPVFVDIDPETCNVDVSQLEKAFSLKTKAVILAHTLGNPFELNAVLAFCEKHRLWLIEDNCDALGSLYEGKYTGTFGDVGTSSFYPPHHLTMGEGGAVYTDNALLKKILLSLRDWGRDCWCESGMDNTCGCRFTRQYGRLPFGYDHKYVYSHFGYNFKPTDMQAAIGCAQLKKIEKFRSNRYQNFRMLYNGLADLKHIFDLPQATAKSVPNWFGFLLTLKNGAPFTRNQIVAHLESAKIQTRNLFAGNITRHPCFIGLKKGEDYYIIGDLKNTEKILNDAFWIGVYPGINKEQIKYITEIIHNFVNSTLNF